jgi:hypothetical protein
MKMYIKSVSYDQKHFYIMEKNQGVLRTVALSVCIFGRDPTNKDINVFLFWGVRGGRGGGRHI